MKILALGDILGKASVEHLKKTLWKKREELGVDFVIANGENASEIYGIEEADAKDILTSGVDVITLGNHTYGKKEICRFLTESNDIIRPANFPPMNAGSGYTIANCNGWKILCINILGTAGMTSLDCPFATVDKILNREKGNYDFAIMDIHAESTGEKGAMGHYFDGRIQMMFGTHTHVTTADERILPKGSGFITDVGMTGPVEGIIGSDVQTVVERHLTKIYCRLGVASGEIRAAGVLYELDTNSKRVTKIERVSF